MTTVARLLRQRTSPTHTRVEAQLDLLGADLTADRLFCVIERFCGFWLSGEVLIDEWAAAHPGEALALQWARRRRASLFAADLAAMGGAPNGQAVVPRAPPVFAQVEEAQVLGWLYVTEGSTLGGTVIDRHLRSRAGLGATAPRCFTPYHEGPGPMWQSFRAVLQGFAAGDCARTGAVLDAAAATFEALECWLVPLAAGSAA